MVSTDRTLEMGHMLSTGIAVRPGRTLWVRGRARKFSDVGDLDLLPPRLKNLRDFLKSPGFLEILGFARFPESPWNSLETH